MKIAIIGHGPSLQRYKPGRDIDAHDKVVRLKRSRHLLQYPEHFGSRTDVVCGSATIGAALKDHWENECTDFWVFVDTRTEGLVNGKLNALVAYFEPNGIHVDPSLCKTWREHYRAIRSDYPLAQGQERKDRLSDDKGHLHPSAGTHSILYALDIHKPDVLRLYGFDSIATGAFTWSLTRGPDWTQYPDHNWETEQRMLNDIAAHYGYQIGVKDNLVVELTK